MRIFKKCVKVYLFLQVMPEMTPPEGESGHFAGPVWIGKM